MTLTRLAAVLIVVASAATVGAAGADAATITLDAVDSGWYQQAGGFGGINNQNYIVGESGFGTTYRNFFIFDLSGVTDTIVGATLRAYNPSANNDLDDGFASDGATETYTLFDVTTSIASLTAGTGGVNAYNDLGGGVQFGAYAASAADNGTIVTIALNGNLLAALNASNGLFALGGAITTLSGSGVGEHLFAWSGPSGANPSDTTRQLVLTTTPVPEPASLLLLGSGVAGIAARARRRKAQ